MVEGEFQFILDFFDVFADVSNGFDYVTGNCDFKLQQSMSGIKTI